MTDEFEAAKAQVRRLVWDAKNRIPLWVDEVPCSFPEYFERCELRDQRKEVNT